MKTTERDILVPARQIHKLMWLLQIHGFKDYTVGVGQTYKFAKITFHDENEYLIFVLKDILKLSKSTDMSYFQPDFNFMIRLEKKMETYSSADEYFIRRGCKDI